MADVNFKELFGSFSAAEALKATEVKKASSFSGNPDLFKPSIKDEKCKDMNYRALVRFIPFYRDGKWCTTLSRWECYLKDVNGENGMFVISPKTDGKKCPMRTLSWQLYQSESAVDKANSKKINVYQQYYALVEVIKDVQHPEYDGKFFIYQFGQKIADKIEAAMKSTEFTEGFNPFDLYDARLFEINLVKDPQKKMDDGKPVANYEGCRFIEKTSPIHFGEGQTLTRGDVDSQKAFFKWLTDGAPNIKEYFWKEWDSETTEKVNSILATYTSGYSAPRTPVAKAQEAVNIVSETRTSNPVPAASVEEDMPAAIADDIPADDAESPNTYSADEENEDWINQVLNG